MYQQKKLENECRFSFLNQTKLKRVNTSLCFFLILDDKPMEQICKQKFNGNVIY